MKRIILITLFICSILCLSACSAQQNVEGEEQNEKNVSQEVVFINLLQSGDNDEFIHEDMLHYMKCTYPCNYDYEQEKNTDTLYAFEFYLNSYYEDAEIENEMPIQAEDESIEEFVKRSKQYRVNLAKEIMKEEGIYVVSDYSNEDGIYLMDCVIACTIDDVIRLSEATEGEISKWNFYLKPATRPDMIELLKEVGWTQEIEHSPYSWYENKKELVQSKTGTETFITLTVQIE